MQRSICSHAPQFSGSEQHDSQEFLSFLLDGLHEDLNRILQKRNIESTPEREAELEKLPTQIASEQEWQIYRMRDDSLDVDFFQGQYRNRMECLTCHKVRPSALCRPARRSLLCCALGGRLFVPGVTGRINSLAWHVTDVDDVQHVHVPDPPDSSRSHCVEGLLATVHRGVR